MQNKTKMLIITINLKFNTIQYAFKVDSLSTIYRPLSHPQPVTATVNPRPASSTNSCTTVQVTEVTAPTAGGTLRASTARDARPTTTRTETESASIVNVIP